jgi:hypothetical protein
MASGQGGTRLFLHIYAQYDNQTGKAKLSWTSTINFRRDKNTKRDAERKAKIWFVGARHPSSSVEEDWYRRHDENR